MIRTASVCNLKIDSVAFSSIVHVGDVMHIVPESEVLAVQRELPIYKGNEGALSQFSIFERPIPKLHFYETVEMSSSNYIDSIKIHTIRIIGVSVASVVQLGNSECIAAESRVKHIRQLLPRKDEEDQSPV